MKSKRCDNAKSKSIYNISHRLLLSVESSKNQKKIIINRNVNFSSFRFFFSRFFFFFLSLNIVKHNYNTHYNELNKINNLLITINVLLNHCLHLINIIKSIEFCKLATFVN